MGFLITNTEIETIDGKQYDSLYVRIEMYFVEKITGLLRIVPGFYDSKESATKAFPSYRIGGGESDLSGMVMVNAPYTLFGEEKESFTEMYKDLTHKELVTITTYSSSFHEAEVEYIDYNALGEEIVAIRTQEVETITTGSAEVERDVINLDIINGDLYSFSYLALKEKCKEIFNTDSIIDNI